jgi:uncharacterized membrane protein YqaE (UPF0057 family)
MSKLLMILLALFIPPLAVALRLGLSTHLFVNIVLTILGVLPGSVHAIWVLITFDE